MVACEIPVLGILKVSRSIRFSFISLFFWPLQKSWHENGDANSGRGGYSDMG